LFRVRRNEDTCIHCSACDKVCPVNIPVESEEEIKSSECINCNLCVNACPVKDTLYISGSKKWRISPAFLLWITLAVFIAVPGVTTLTGTFEWTIKPLSETFDESGRFDPEAIRGSNTFSEISDITGIPMKRFIKQFNITEEEFEQPIKNSAHKPNSEFDTEDVREFIKEELLE
jgi:ferredoxin